MKIDGNNAHSINFIEQKKSTTSEVKQKETISRFDSYESTNITKTAILELNDSLAMLQIANDSIKKLQDGSEELQKLNEKFSFFQSQKIELEEKFEESTVKMLDVIDNTMFKDSGLFYSNHTIKVNDTEFSLTMLSNNSIEDFSLGKNEEIENFSSSLANIKKDITSIKDHIHTANFNQIAALHINSPLANIESSMFKSDSKVVEVDIEGIKQAHDTSLLKDKLSYLLD